MVLPPNVYEPPIEWLGIKLKITEKYQKNNWCIYTCTDDYKTHEAKLIKFQTE